MTAKQEIEKVTKNVALRAFEFAVCQSFCKEDKDKSKRCIEKKGGCDMRTNFIKKLD